MRRTPGVASPATVAAMSDDTATSTNTGTA